MSKPVTSENNSTPAAMRWTGRVISGLMGLAMAASAVMKFSGSPDVAKGMDHLGWPDKYATGLGITELICAVLYLIPQTAVLGAILLTGYLGGAMASHVRIGSPLFTHTLFGLYLGLMVWGGLWLRDRNLQTLIPFRR
jgi:hypothetical protein